MLTFIADTIDAVTQRIGTFASWLTLALVLLVAADVGLRYVFNLSFVAVREVEWHLYALIFLLGAAYTLKHDAHVRVDVICQYFGPRTRALVNVLGTVLFLLPGCWLLIKTSINFVQYAYMIGETSPDPGGLPLRWLIKAAIPFGFGLVALQGVAFLIRNLLILITPPSATERPE